MHSVFSGLGVDNALLTTDVDIQCSVYLAEKRKAIYMTGLLHEGIFHVRGLCEPAIFDSLPWAYVMCNWAQILVHRRH